MKCKNGPIKYHIKETQTAAVSDIKDPVYEQKYRGRHTISNGKRKH